MSTRYGTPPRDRMAPRVAWDVRETTEGVELALYPAGETLDRTTRWLTASEGSWVTLEANR
jgi:hypothetical protein